MLRYRFTLLLPLLYQAAICSNVYKIAPSSQKSFTQIDDSISDVNIWKNFTGLLVDDENRFKLSRNTTFLNNIKNIDDELWDIDRLLEIWNPIVVSQIWNNETYRDARISLSCGEDLTRYMLGISKRKIWTQKMMDADGKRTWGIFSGSTYWIGDINQCRKMENEFVKWQKGTFQQSEELPPFRVSVNSISLTLEILKPGLNMIYNVTLGLCMPITCDTKDIESLLYFAQDLFNTSLSLKINQIRNLSKGYTFWEDSIFYILLIVFIVVCMFTFIGTFYDVVLRYKILGKRRDTDNGISTESKFMTTTEKLHRQVTFSKLWTVTTHIGSLDARNSQVTPRPLPEALLSFSLFVNIYKLCSLEVGADTLAPIHGLRFYTMLWIILMHTCLLANEISDSKTFRNIAENDFLYQTIGNGTYSVDTFFFISGCLVTFLYYRTMANKRLKDKKIIKGCCGQLLQFLAMMWYRYFRLTPIYLLVIGLIQVSMKWYHDHSMIELPTLDYQTCEKFWWRNALYINTYFDLDERCMVWSWYLANDTQFYVVGIIILIIGTSFLPIAIFIVAFFLIASWVTTAIITLNTRHVPSIHDPFAHYASLYDKPWMRIGPYFIGMATGWYLFRNDCKANMNKVVVTLGWILSLVTMMSIVYGLYGTTFSPVLSAFYTALSHSGWAVCLAWILIACVTNHGGIVNHMLSWKYLYPISRLTYCAYLVHPALIRAMILQGESSWHLTHGFVAFLFFGVVVVSYAVSLFLSLFFEAPIVSLLRIVHPLRAWKFIR